MQFGSIDNLVVWKKALSLAKSVYMLSKDFPSDEKFGLCDQMRRAAVSISSNIAEGHGRMTDKEFLHFLSIANGSLYELESQLLLSIEIYPHLGERCKELLTKISEEKRLIRSLVHSLRTRISH